MNRFQDWTADDHLRAAAAATAKLLADELLGILTEDTAYAGLYSVKLHLSFATAKRQRQAANN